MDVCDCNSDNDVLGTNRKKTGGRISHQGNRTYEGTKKARILGGRAEADSTERGESSRVTVFNVGMYYSGAQVECNMLSF